MHDHMAQAVIRILFNMSKHCLLYTPTTGHISLIVCQVRRKKQSLAESVNSTDDIDDGGSADCGYSSIVLSPALIPRQLRQEQQCNFVKVQNPSGGTPIVINVDTVAGTTTTCTNMRALNSCTSEVLVQVSTHPLSHIAPGPNVKQTSTQSINLSISLNISLVQNLKLDRMLYRKICCFLLSMPPLDLAPEVVEQTTPLLKMALGTGSMQRAKRVL